MHLWPIIAGRLYEFPANCPNRSLIPVIYIQVVEDLHDVAFKSMMTGGDNFRDFCIKDCNLVNPVDNG